jgi:hypothetical protein
LCAYLFLDATTVEWRDEAPGTQRDRIMPDRAAADALTNSHGTVMTGQSCYMMPLCTWHSSTARNHQPSGHTQTRMLELSGYMQAEPAATFLARLPTDAIRTLVGADGSQMFTADLAEPHVDTLWYAGPDVEEGGLLPGILSSFPADPRGWRHQLRRRRRAATTADQRLMPPAASQ